jgi:uncharacterized membrane protein YjfL (UPF0719 family)
VGEDQLVEENNMSTFTQQSIEAIVYVIIAFLALYIIKLITDRAVKKYYQADVEIEENSNSAIALRRAGLYIGFALGFAGSLSGSSSVSFTDELLLQALDFALISLFLLSSFIIADKVLLPKIENTKALLENNLAVGAVEMGLFVSTGLIAAASFSGSGDVVDSVIFFLLGQLILMIVGFIYVIKSRYDVYEELHNGNFSAGIMFGGMMVAIAIVLSGSISGESTTLKADLIAFGESALFAIVLILLFFSTLIDKLFFPKSDLEVEIKRDKNVAAIVITVAIKIALAVIISAVLV